MPYSVIKIPRSVGELIFMLYCFPSIQVLCNVICFFLEIEKEEKRLVERRDGRFERRGRLRLASAPEDDVREGEETHRLRLWRFGLIPSRRSSVDLFRSESSQSERAPRRCFTLRAFLCFCIQSVQTLVWVFPCKYFPLDLPSLRNYLTLPSYLYP